MVKIIILKIVKHRVKMPKNQILQYKLEVIDIGSKGLKFIY